MLVLILITTATSLLMPLIFRRMIDITIPTGNVPQLVLLSLALLFIPAFNGLVNVIQRQLNARVGEGVIYDLRVALFAHLQRMSLRFFTNTKVGELMSRLNNDVVGAQNAISNTIVSIVTNLIQATAVLLVMLTLEWRLTLISVLILPLFILAARQLGTRLRDISRQQMDANAAMNAMMNETLNIGGALLVKLFGRRDVETDRFAARARVVRDTGMRRAVVGVIFFVIIGLLSAVGTALVYGIGGYLVIQGAFTIGTIVAFGAYLTQPVQRAARTGECAGRFCHLDGQLRARLRGDRSSHRDPGEAGRRGAADGQRRAGLRRCLFPLRSRREEPAQRGAALRADVASQSGAVRRRTRPQWTAWRQRRRAARAQPGAQSPRSIMSPSARGPASWRRWSGRAARARPPSPT